MYCYLKQPDGSAHALNVARRDFISCCELSLSRQDLDANKLAIGKCLGTKANYKEMFIESRIINKLIPCL